MYLFAPQLTLTSSKKKRIGLNLTALNLLCNNYAGITQIYSNTNKRLVAFIIFRDIKIYSQFFVKLPLLKI